MPQPKGGIHLAVSRTRLGQLNDPGYTSKLVKAVEDLIQTNNPKTVLVLSEQSLLPLILAKQLKMSHGKVVCYELNHNFREVLEATSKVNDLDQVLDIRHDVKNYHEITDKIDEPFDLILGEPNFSICMLPWHNLFYWYMLKSFTSKTISPFKATVWCLPVQFQHLWKIRAPLNEVEGFNVKYFDEIILKACDVSDAAVEPQPLWEYPCKAISAPKALMTFDFTQDIPKEIISEEISFNDIKVNRKGSGMVFWMDWSLTDKVVVSGGPVEKVKIGEIIEWYKHCKQGVHFFIEQSKNNTILEDIQVKAVFNPQEGELSFHFS